MGSACILETAICKLQLILWATVKSTSIPTCWGCVFPSHSPVTWTVEGTCGNKYVSAVSNRNKADGKTPWNPERNHDYFQLRLWCSCKAPEKRQKSGFMCSRQASPSCKDLFTSGQRGFNGSDRARASPSIKSEDSSSSVSWKTNTSQTPGSRGQTCFWAFRE